MKAPLAIVALCCAALAGCGTPGAPQPPSLLLPQPVQDLAATRLGNKVLLTWTPPRETTDHVGIRHAGPTLVCRATATMVRCAAIATLPPSPLPNGQTHAEFTDTLPPGQQQQNPLGFVTYALEVQNDRGRSAGLSNQVQTPLAPTPAPPQDLSAQVTPDAVRITTTPIEKSPALPGLSSAFHLYRRADNAAAEADLGQAAEIQDTGALVFDDRTFDWEKTYLYRVAAVTTVALPQHSPIEVPGDSTRSLKVVVHDTFPPAQPGGVQAVASGVGQAPFVDLTWAPNTDSDLAGYNVYRHEDGQPPVKINSDLVKTPAYRDAQVAPGHRYFYSVSAVDLRGNQSARSPEASEAVPNQ